MSPLTRRDFLKRSGALIAAAPLVTLDRPQAVAPQETLGRAFDVTDIHIAPSLSSTVVGQLAPDSVNEIAAVQTRWYQVTDGWVPRSALQPISPYHYPEVSETTDFWAEAITPITTVRAWCAGRAPIIARLGYGAVVYVMDRIVDDYKQVWYGVAAETALPLLGWTPALHYERLTSPPSLVLKRDPLSEFREGEQVNNGAFFTEPLIRITDQRELLVYDRGKAVAAMSIYAPALQSGTAMISRVQPGTAHDIALPLGRPWFMRLDNGISVHGAFWHNRFGEMGNSRSIELSTFAARWLYERLQSNVKVVIE